MERTFHDGREDGLDPLEALDVRAADGVAGMLRGMGKTAFGGRELGEAFDVFSAMVDDPDCRIVVTISGAMTVGKMGLVLCEMIRGGMVDMIVSTGAIMAHGLSEAIGGVHYRYDPDVPDEVLFERGYNRVYDTLEMETNLSDTAELVASVLADMDWTQTTCSWRINREIGRRLMDRDQMPSVLGCACERDVPVYVPAFTDSEMGLDVATHFMQGQAGKSGVELLDAAPPYNPFHDLYDFARRILGARRLGIFTVGGGVPRNWAQQVGPFVDLINMRLGQELAVPRYQYAVRICPEPVHWGGLSGCTYTEGVSWGKFVSPAEGGRFAEVHCDATIAWPLLVRGVLEQRGLTEE